MMRSIVAAILCCGLIIGSLAAAQVAAQPTQAVAVAVAPQAAGEAAAELKSQQQRLDFFKDRLDLQDKRIGDLGLSLALFGALITAVVVFFSLRATREAVLAAKEDARKEIEEQAEKLIKNWLNNDGGKLLVDKAGTILDELEMERQKAREHNLRQERLLSELASFKLDKDKPLSEEQKEQIEATVQELQDKPLSQYRSEDWFMLGMQAFKAGTHPIAADYFGKSAEVAEQPIEKATALYNKGVMLRWMEKYTEAIAVFEDIVSRYDGAKETDLWGQVADALNGWGFNLLCEAKRQWNSGVAPALLGQALEKIEQSLERQSTDPITLGNKGYILFLQGKVEEATPILAEAIRLGGEKLRQAELKDTEVHPLPQDEEFKALINSL